MTLIVFILMNLFRYELSCVLGNMEIENFFDISEIVYFASPLIYDRKRLIKAFRYSVFVVKRFTLPINVRYFLFQDTDNLYFYFRSLQMI